MQFVAFLFALPFVGLIMLLATPIIPWLFLAVGLVVVAKGFIGSITRGEW